LQRAPWLGARSGERVLSFVTAADALTGATTEPPHSGSHPASTAPRNGPCYHPGSLLRAVVVAGYCGVQLVLPLRFLWYGDNVSWHEQGMRFAWRVMVREKNGTVTYFVTSKNDGRTFQINPERYLTRYQAREMSGQPDLIVQLAQHIQRDFAERGFGPSEVRAEALVSLNGRKLAPLIDPKLDLTSIADGLGRASYVLPAPETEPPLLRAL
jgi:vitamin K-dependent gamma-carboxylase